MRLIRLEISGVRNLSGVSLECSRGLNLFVGSNGAGKTAILEAIHLLARGRSFRSTTAESVIQRGSEYLMVRARLEDEHRGVVSVGLAKHRGNRTELHLNEVPERRLSDVARLMPIQLALPDSSDLVFGAPQERRRFVDWGTFHVEPAYLDQLRDYQRALAQRNALLRYLKGQQSESTERELDVWTERLIGLASRVDRARQSYVARLFPVVLMKLGSLAPEVGLAISYRTGWREGETLEDCLRESAVRDVKFGLTHYGPHRGDVRLSVDAGAAAATLSRGQAKVVASALRLAQAQLTNEIGGRQSVFLIDDVGAELDAAHNERFFQALEATGSQVFATATSALALGSAFAGRRQVFHVEQGSCHPIDTTREP
jgi:DNA replication and repair protein RecF